MIRVKEDANRLFFKSDKSEKIKLKYPHIQDESFPKKIALKKEFQYFYDSEINKDIVEEDKEGKLCSYDDFTLAPHQEFTKAFMSRDTPYNGLLLYHGMGSGKTCSAIGICEEYRKTYTYDMKFKKIIIVASPNVQDNFKSQLIHLNNISQENGIWKIDGCIGNQLLKELKLEHSTMMSKEQLYQKIMKFIKKKYMFIGYEKLANIIEELLNQKTKSKAKQNIRDYFDDRMLVVDEAHNVRMVGDNQKTKKVARAFQGLVKYTKYMKLLFLSGTPMYNDPKEIIFLLSLLNQNDGQSPLKTSDIFDNHGEFITHNGEEIGKQRLASKANGYVSYVRGENPFQFPFKIFPSDYKSEYSIFKHSYPKKQLNGKLIDMPIQHLDIYCNSLSSFQENAYHSILHQKTKNMTPEMIQKYEESDSFTYHMLQEPLNALTLCVPKHNDPTILLCGKQALDEVVQYDSHKSHFEYNHEDFRIFQHDHIGEYSVKIKTILDSALESKGIILVYSQFLDSGLIPIALALEELGFQRANQPNLFTTLSSKQPKRSQYAMITGDIYYSVNNQEELNIVNHTNNIHGETCKVVLISQAGSEGLDFKNLRQVHILEPWYNMNRIDQIIGRAIRNCSHKSLPLQERNCQIFLHGSILKKDDDEECVDMMMYRNAEKKAQKIGKVQKVLKSVSIDCLLNVSQLDFMNMKQTVNIVLANNKQIKEYPVKDKPYSSICDYGECGHTCSVTLNSEDGEIVKDSFQLTHVMSEKVIKQIKKLFLKGHLFTKKQLIDFICTHKITLEHLDYALTFLLENESEIIIDKFLRKGRLTNVKDLYFFRPIQLNHDLSLEEQFKPFESTTKMIQIQSHVDVSKPTSHGNRQVQLLQNTLQKIKNEYTKAEDSSDFSKSYDKTVEKMEHLVPDIRLTPTQNDLYLLHHILECLTFREEKVIIQYLFKNVLDEFELKLKDYYMKFIYKHDDSHEILFLVDSTKKITKKTNDRDKRHILIKNNDTSDWEDITTVEYNEIGDESIQSFLKDQIPVNMAEQIGFISFHKDDIYALKVKESKKNNMGAFFHQKIPKKMRLELNHLIGNKVFSEESHDQSSVDKTQLCIMMELLLRYYEETQKDGLHYFINKLQYSMIV